MPKTFYITFDLPQGILSKDGEKVVYWFEDAMAFSSSEAASLYLDQHLDRLRKLGESPVVSARG